MPRFTFQRHEDIAVIREGDQLVAVAKRSGSMWTTTVSRSPGNGMYLPPLEYMTYTLEEMMHRLEAGRPTWWDDEER